MILVASYEPSTTIVNSSTTSLKLRQYRMLQSPATSHICGCFDFLQPSVSMRMGQEFNLYHVFHSLSQQMVRQDPIWYDILKSSRPGAAIIALNCIEHRAMGLGLRIEEEEDRGMMYTVIRAIEEGP
jgi:hypothetical protein